MADEEYRTVNCGGPLEFERHMMGKREVKLVKDDAGICRPRDCPNFVMDGEMCTFRGKQAYCKYVRTV